MRSGHQSKQDEGEEDQEEITEHDDDAAKSVRGDQIPLMTGHSTASHSHHSKPSHSAQIDHNLRAKGIVNVSVDDQFILKVDQVDKDAEDNSALWMISQLKSLLGSIPKNAQG